MSEQHEFNHTDTTATATAQRSLNLAITRPAASFPGAPMSTESPDSGKSGEDSGSRDPFLMYVTETETLREQQSQALQHHRPSPNGGGGGGKHRNPHHPEATFQHDGSALEPNQDHELFDSNGQQQQPQQEHQHHHSPEKCNVFVAGLTPSIGDTELRELFQAYGAIVSAKIMLDLATGRSRLFGFVLFETQDAAAKAVREMNRVLLPGGTQPLHVAFASHDDRAREAECECIYVRNLPEWVTATHLEELFKKYGNDFRDAIIVPARPSRSCSRGVGFVRYHSITSAKHAIEKLAHSTVFGTEYPLLLRFMESKDMRQNRLVHQQHTLARDTATRAAPSTQINRDELKQLAKQHEQKDATTSNPQPKMPPVQPTRSAPEQTATNPMPVVVAQQPQIPVPQMQSAFYGQPSFVPAGYPMQQPAYYMPAPYPAPQYYVPAYYPANPMFNPGPLPMQAGQPMMYYGGMQPPMMAPSFPLPRGY